MAGARDSLLASAETVRVDWAESEFAPAASGDVVWSQVEQQGYLRISGLPANDPTERQYQLWIFDAEQEHPVDGGVFDMPDSDPNEPGGVVVSKRETIALLASLDE